jgi:membrane protein
MLFRVSFVPLVAAAVAGAAVAEWMRSPTPSVFRNGAAANVARAARERGRGRQANTPGEIPAAGWRDILWRTWEQINVDRVLAVAAGVTFYSLLALFPALTALVSIYGLFADRATMIDHLTTLSGFLPGGAIEIISGQMERIVSQPAETLGVGFAVGLGFALWSANQGVKAMFDALNVAYGEQEKRGFFALNALSLTFTLLALLFILAAIGAIVVLPAALAHLGLDGADAPWLQYGRWPALVVVLITLIAILYRFGPSREHAKWRWITPGGALAALVWVAASIGFSWYVGNFGSYNETYGSLGAVIGFMTWIWVSATIILAGAELNAQMEHQTSKDTTTGDPVPMGFRGAKMADSVGAAQ